MSGNLFHRRSLVRSGVFSRRKRLGLEHLEERALLSATGWGGFESNPELNVYSIGTSDIRVDFSSNNNLDLVGVCDFDGDGQNDMVTVNGADTSSPRLAVFNGQGDGFYENGQMTTLSTGASGAVLADVTGDGILDFVAVSQNMSNDSILNIRVYQYQADGTFSLTKTSDLSLTVFGHYVNYVATTIYVAQVGDSLAVQLQNCYAFDSSGNNYILSGTVICVGDGAGGFSSPKTIASFTGTAVGSVDIDGTDYLVSLNKETRAFTFWGYSASKNAWTASGSIDYATLAGSIGVSNVAASGSHLYFSGNLSGKTLVYDLSLTVSGGVVRQASSQYNTLSKLYSGSVVLACGDVNSDSLSDLMIVHESNYTALLAQSNGTFSEAKTVIAQTDYLNSYVTDVNGDGVSDILTVGAYGVWVVNGNDLTADPMNYGTFVYAAQDAVFGDFDGDGKMEIAVLESGTNLVSVYDYLGGSYNRIRIIENPTQTVDGTTITAAAVDFAVGRFTQTVRDELLVSYSWLNGSSGLLYVYNATTGTRMAQTTLASGETAVALTVGGIYGSVYDDIAAVIRSEAGESAVIWKNNTGVFTRSANVVLGTSSGIKALAVGDVNGDDLADLVFLTTGNGTGGGLGWLLQNAAGFSASSLTWGTTVSVAGTLDGLLLADITGDGMLDVFTTLTVTGTDGITRSTIYFAEGDSSAATDSLLGNLNNYAFTGDAAAGINFDGGSLTGPSLTLWANSTTELGDVVMVKGKTIAVVRSKASLVADGGFLYLVHDAASAKPTAVITDVSEIGSDYYGWIDEWSRFYVEIWGTLDGSAISQFRTALNYRTDYFVYENVESGDGFTVTATAVDGMISVFGSVAAAAVSTASGEYHLLARLKFTPAVTAGAGIPIPENGLFMANASGLSAVATEESINDSQGCSKSVTTALNELDLFSVRLDYNDDGNIDVADFTAFANNYGYGTAGKPFKDAKAETFNTVAGNGLDVQDFTVFANSYGITRASVTGRFYDRFGLDPTEWVTAAATIPRETVQKTSLSLEIAEISADAVFEEAFPVLAEEETKGAVLPLWTPNESVRDEILVADSSAVLPVLATEWADPDFDETFAEIPESPSLTLFIPNTVKNNVEKRDAKDSEIEINL